MSNPVSGPRFCPNCGRPAATMDRFCVACGVAVPQLVPLTQPSFPPSSPTYSPYPGYQPYPGAQTIEYAGFWRRFAALLIDIIIFVVVDAILALAVGPGVVVLGTIGQWLYFALMESSQYQATLGKLALGIVVTNGHGGRVGFGQATGRYFGKYLSSFIMCVGYMMAGWTERKQTLHDMMADCLVVCKYPGW